MLTLCSARAWQSLPSVPGLSSKRMVNSLVVGIGTSLRCTSGMGWRLPARSNDAGILLLRRRRIQGCCWTAQTALWPPTGLLARNRSEAKISGGVFRRDVVLQVLDRFFLLRDNPLHQVTDGDNSKHLLALHNREMTYAVSGHDIHARVHGLLRGHENHWAGHDLLDQGRPRRSSLEDDLPGVIALRDDAHELAVRNHEQGPHRLVGHSFYGLVDGLIWRDNPDFAALAF